MTKEIVEVRPCEWNGVSGWQADGWAGETKDEAVMEMCLQEANGDSGAAADRFANIEIIEAE